MENHFNFVLASKSPRRKELLEQLKIPFKIIGANIDEVTSLTDPVDVAEGLAKLKGSKVFEELLANRSIENPFVVGSDTLVALEGTIYGKPTDREDARRILLELSGKRHQVVSGVYIGLELDGEKIEVLFSEQTWVSFEKIDPYILETYLDTGESLDKAGAYGIQAQSLGFVSKIEGTYSNVVGFPLSMFVLKMQELFGEDSWSKIFRGSGKITN